MTQEALNRIAEKLRRAGASLPAPEVTGTIEGSIVTGLCIALALVESEIEALAQPEQEPVAHCKVRPLRGDESFPKVEIDWVNQPVPGPLYTSPPQRTEQEPVATDWNAVHKKLELVWYRELSADEGLDEIQDLINTTPPQRTEQEPAGWEVGVVNGVVTRRLAPPQRKPLTASEIVTMYAECPTSDNDMIEFARAIEAAHDIEEKT